MILCPISNGIDIHRIWEVLYAKKIPVVIQINDFKLYDLYSQLSIIIILDTIDDLDDKMCLEDI